jgi:type II secretory pathway pseudopilin PulG
MRVNTVGDKAGAALRKRRFATRRKRGTTLVEMVLYLAIVSMVMTFSLGLLREDQIRRERIALAAELQQVTTAAQTYVSANYETIRDQLLRETPAGSNLIKAYGMDALVAQGYLPAIFAQTGTSPKSFVGSLQYGLAVRAVLRSDRGYETGTFPVTQQRIDTLTEPGTNPLEFDDVLIDNDYLVNPATGAVVNDEIDLEALLITISSDPCVIVPAAQGPRVVSQSESNAAGYVTGLGDDQEIPDTCSAEVQNNLAWREIEADGTPLETPLMATGPYGGWRLPLEPYADLLLTSAEFPNRDGQVFNGEAAVQAGRFVSLLALPKRPPLSESAKVAQEIAQDAGSGLRCADVPTDSSAELACKQSDLMYAGLSFTSWDSDNDGIDDTFPGLLNVNTLDMGPAPADGTAQITDLLSLSCATGEDVPTASGRFTVDCPTTQMQGLVVTSAATFETDVTVSGDVSAASATVTNQLAAGTVAVEGDVLAASATVANQLVVGGSTASAMSASAMAPETGKIILNGKTGDIILYGESLAEKFTARRSHQFSGEEFLPVAKPKCPTGFAPDIEVMPVTFNIERDLRGITTAIDPKELGPIDPERWRVQLVIMVERSGNDSDQKTLTNPKGSEVVVLTGCKRT